MPSSDAPILEARKLSRQFSGFFAVKDVDLSVRRHSVHALIGPNGAGKTTFFNLLTTFLAPTSGQVFFNGRDISRSMRMVWPIFSMMTGARPSVGSSSSSRRAPVRRMRAIASICCSPPDSRVPWLRRRSFRFGNSV